MPLSTDTQKNLNERFQELPTNLQQLLTGEYLPSVLDALVAQHKLNDAQAAILSNEVTMVLLGFSDKDEFVKQLNTALADCPDATKQQLVIAVKTEIFTLFERELSFVAEAIAAVAEEELETSNDRPEMRPDSSNTAPNAPKNIVSQDGSTASTAAPDSANFNSKPATPLASAPTQTTLDPVLPQPIPPPPPPLDKSISTEQVIPPIPAPSTSTQAELPPSNPVSNPQATPPTPTTTIPAMRTMQQDSQQVQENVHSSSQSDLLTNRELPPNTPANQATDSRWPSEGGKGG